MERTRRPALTLVAAVASDGGIGRDGGLLVRIPEDLKRFRALTTGHTVVMGRRTWDSIGRPLPGRDNIVVTRQSGWRADGAIRAASLDDALAQADPAKRVFVIGGAELYRDALPAAGVLELTEIDAAWPADTFFPPWDRADFGQTSRQEHALPDGTRYAYVTWRRVNGSERDVG